MINDLFGYKIKIEKNKVCNDCLYVFVERDLSNKNKYYCKAFKNSLNENGFKMIKPVNSACALYEERK